MTAWQAYLRAAPEKADLSLAELGTRYVAELARLDSPMTRHIGSWVKRHLEPSFGTFRPDEIGPRELEAWIRWRMTEGLDGRPAAPLTIRKELTFLSGLYVLGVEIGAAAANPVPLISRKARPSKRPRDATRAAAEVRELAQIAHLLFCSKVRFVDRLLFAALTLTGARIGEVSGAEWKDVRLDAHPLGEYRIVRQRDRDGRLRPPKTREIRRVPVHPLFAWFLAISHEEFSRAFGRAPEPHDPLCWREVDGAPRRWGQKIALRRWHRALLLAGIPHPAAGPRREHAARHTLISQLLRAGAAERWVKKLTHADGEDPSSFGRYAHPDWSALCQAVLHLHIPGALEREIPRGGSGRAGRPRARSTEARK